MENNFIPVNHIAQLASIELSSSFKEMIEKELKDVLDYIGKLKGLSTDEIEAAFQVIPMVKPLREDDPIPSFHVEDILANAPEKEGNYFRVLPVLGEEV